MLIIMNIATGSFRVSRAAGQGWEDEVERNRIIDLTQPIRIIVSAISLP